MSSPRPTRANIIPISRYAPVSTAKPETELSHGNAATDAPLPAPAEQQEGESTPNWEKHFFMAPNVRFTRTPDRPAGKAGETQTEISVAPAPVESLPPASESNAPVKSGNWDVIALSSLLSTALDEPLPAPTASPEAPPIASADIPVGPMAYLSDHAFFDLDLPTRSRRA